MSTLTSAETAVAEAAVRARRERRWFAAGATLVIVGAALHWPDFVSMAGDHYQMVGVTPSPWMWLGMTLIVAGLVTATIGFMPAARSSPPAAGLRSYTMDNRGLSGADVRLVGVLMFALVIDVMKPATIGFVIPGARAEYHLSTLQIALWPLVALTGTMLGSLFWGLLADRIGRRPSTLLAALLFVATSICGAMPSFTLNLFMCLLMGLSAGGMLPLTFALLTEFMPRRHRSWLTVFMGSVGSAGGYLAASLAAALLAPAFSWRVLWLIGMPTGLLICLLSRYIPESPRFLLQMGRIEEAAEVERRYGVRLVAERAETTAPAHHPHHAASLGTLLRPPHGVRTAALVVYGVGWGMTNFGFLTWLPSLLVSGAGSAGLASGLIARSAVIALPGAALMGLMYGLWRTRASLLLFALGISASVFAVALLIEQGSPGWLMASFLMVLLTTINGSSAALSSYSTELYPTAVRGTGAGVTAAAMKLGGIIGPQILAFAIALQVGPLTPSVLLSVLVLVGGVLLWRNGVETRGRRLEGN